MRMKTAITKTVTKEFVVIITEAELRKRFRLPADAVITVRDADGDQLPVDDRLTARWTRQS